MKLIDFFQSAVIPSEARDLTRFEILPDFGGFSLSAQLGMTVLQCGIHRSGSCRTRDDGGKSRSMRSLTAARAWRDGARFSSLREQAVRGLAKFCARVRHRWDAATESKIGRASCRESVCIVVVAACR